MALQIPTACPYCAEQLPPGHPTCPTCRLELLACPECDTFLLRKDSYCPGCLRPIASTSDLGGWIATHVPRMQDPRGKLALGGAALALVMGIVLAVQLLSGPGSPEELGEQVGRAILADDDEKIEELLAPADFGAEGMSESERRRVEREYAEHKRTKLRKQVKAVRYRLKERGIRDAKDLDDLEVVARRVEYNSRLKARVASDIGVRTRSGKWVRIVNQAVEIDGTWYFVDLD